MARGSSGWSCVPAMGREAARACVIAFYGHGHDSPYPEFSNFYWQERPFEFFLPPFARRQGYPNSIWCHFSEKAIMATKAALMNDMQSFRAIDAAEDPATCKDLGRSVRNFDDELWLKHLETVAFEVVSQKFSSSEALRAVLLSTGDAILAEAAPHDAIWGIGLPWHDPRVENPDKWRGRNILGSALMRTREALRRRGGSGSVDGGMAEGEGHGGMEPAERTEDLMAVGSNAASAGGAARVHYEDSVGNAPTVQENDERRPSSGMGLSSHDASADRQPGPSLRAYDLAVAPAGHRRAKRWSRSGGAMLETNTDNRQVSPAVGDDLVPPARDVGSAFLVDCFAVLDFEATCGSKAGEFEPQEVIELPIVLVCPQKRVVVAEFRTYVRPLFRPELTEFCTELTGIRQSQVDEAPAWPEAFAQAQAWLDAHLAAEGFRHCVFVTCGDWDLQTMLVNQCALSQQRIPDRFREWLNIKSLFRNITHKRGGSMKMMLNELGLPLHGRHHSGLDDSRNIASILIELLRRGLALDQTMLSRSW